MTDVELKDLAEGLASAQAESERMLTKVLLEADQRMKKDGLRLKEADQRLREADQRMKEADQRQITLDRQLRFLPDNIGRLADKFGRFTESLASPPMEKRQYRAQRHFRRRDQEPPEA